MPHIPFHATSPYVYRCLHISKHIYAIYMFTCIYGHICPINVFILRSSYTPYTCLHTSTTTNALYILTYGPCTYICVHFIAPIYIYMYANFDAHIPIHYYIFLGPFNYTCVCTSRPTYMYMFMFLYTYLYTHIPTHLYIPSLPYTYT